MCPKWTVAKLASNDGFAARWYALERSEPPKAGANGLHKVGTEMDEGTIVVSPSMVTGLENF